MTSKSPPTRSLRERPDLDQLKRQAKELLDAFRAGEPPAVEEVRAYYRGADRTSFALHDAQLVLARAHGFDGWPKLKAFVDGVTVKRLAEVVRDGDVATARAMLDARPELADMQMSYGDEHRPLHFAVMHRRPEMVRLLMERGANARAGIHPNRDATGALTIAIEREYDEIVAIIDDAEQRRREEASATSARVTSAQDELSAAISSRDSRRALEMLEREPATVNASDREGQSPLHVAAAAHDEHVVRWLLEHGADVSPRDAQGRTALDRAARSRYASDAFLRVAALLVNHKSALTPRAAVALGDAGWIRARHAEGTLVDDLDWHGGGLLTTAVRHGRADVLALLLDLGFDPDEPIRSRDPENQWESAGLPLWDCAARGERAMAELLLAHGADPNACVDSSGTAVFSAYSRQQWEMVDLLRRHGGVVSADTAALFRQTDVAREMLSADDRGELPARSVSPGRSLAEDLLEFGASGGASEIVRMALERIRWPRDDTRWFYMLSRPLDFWNHIPWLSSGDKTLDRTTYIDCFRAILDRCNPNLRARFGRTVLHEVGAFGDHVQPGEAIPFAVALLEAGARTNVRDDLFRSTPLGWACRWGRADIVKVLLDHGADPDEDDAEAWARPRAWARKAGRTDILQLLDSSAIRPARES